MIKNKFEFPEKGFRVNLGQEKPVVEKPKKEVGAMFSIVLEEGGVESQWGQENPREMSYIGGSFYLDGRKIPAEKAREEVLKSGVLGRLSKRQRELLGVEDFPLEEKMAG